MIFKTFSIINTLCMITQVKSFILDKKLVYIQKTSINLVLNSLERLMVGHCY